MENTTSSSNLFPVSDTGKVKSKVLNWVKQFDTFCLLDNHQYQLQPHTEECLLAAGAKRKLRVERSGDALHQLQKVVDERKGWLFGHLSYDLKNEIEALSSGHEDHTGFPDLCFFEPEIIIRLSANGLYIESADPEEVYDEIISTIPSEHATPHSFPVRSRFSREEYIAVIENLKKHIQRGDCYEINFCQEFYIEKAQLDPVHLYKKLSEVSPNPFSALYRTGDQWLICASPERFLCKQGDKIISQPIKGTSRRVLDDPQLDEQSKTDLYISAKDRSENVMVVDLVRNDLSRICREGTVTVEELFHVYTFPQVHQMISMVSGKLDDEVSFENIIRATFPMGSMTGAPKKKVMELIEQYEKTKRGIFSGAVGYIAPSGDFDFNVVIRSIMYNAASGYLSFQAGSGITWYSEADKEWEECLLKAAAIKEVLAG